MHVPLDYYRILGLPIQATADQLQQAHRDRGVQLPRREFSEVAIAARKQLIDDAYQVLSDPDYRRDYDSRFLADAYAAEPTPDSSRPAGLAVRPDLGEAALRSLATEPGAGEVPSNAIAIESELFAGALLILLELGEYEQVIHLGRPYLSSGTGSLADGQFGDPALVQGDVVLTLALACLELGREQWHQRQYETAAESLETGHELLAKENRFPALRAEIQSELYKLRPYRILELLARPLDQTKERRQGLKLLKSMLEDRGGIEGSEDDLSGLAIDDFLRFIQQLRDYLTASEQQELFEHEARRPSPVATYLTVYALLARGFARHQPALVRRAKQLLMGLAHQQDVHLEQAVCAMLLGQTEEANRALEFSQEYEPLAYIREHSRNSPDLLPGLCLYTERWIQDELFPHFRDFKDQDATLKDYFANPQVQSYLEAMVPGPEAAWEGVDPGAQGYSVPTVEGSLPIHAPSLASPASYQRPAMATPPATNGYSPDPPAPRANHNGYGGADLGYGAAEIAVSRNGRAHPAAKAPDPAPPDAPALDAAQAAPAPRPAQRSKAAQPKPGRPKPERLKAKPPALDPRPAERTSSDQEPSVAERVAQLSPEGQLKAATKAKVTPPSPRPSRSRSPKPSLPAAMASDPSATVTQLEPGSRRKKSTSPRWGRLALVGMVGLLGLGTLGFATARTVSWLTGAVSGPRLEGRPLDLSLAEPAVEIPSLPSPDEQIGAASMAQQVIETWLSAKSAAMGEDYQADQLATVLTGSLLSQWQRRAAAAPQENWYWRYEHEVAVQSVTPDDPTADRLQVIALVRENARLFEFGVENDQASYDERLTMEYTLVRQDGQWFIESMRQAPGRN
ncbi:molecular chaperone DnaJ [Leptolyngbya sp. BL0902]|uniref:IMS domain-containing protein n=1 Tax=Leptolyngbya sp. BL0902 TaxID=1115757 RepID=UPI0018E71AF7|nr:IMS domain-containing protein [Leptolyngbya sp. BL0902]QQE63936.1 molecular chaperone DnaJ [Leptolyngbya sp. BL0902]